MINFKKNDKNNFFCKYSDKELILTPKQRYLFNNFMKTYNENYQCCLQNIQRSNTLKLPDKISEDLLHVYQ